MQNNEQWKEELEQIRCIINKLPLQKTIKWGSDVYTFNGKNVVSYGGFKNYFAIWFYNGVFLKDNDKVLINAQEGKTKSLRQWRFTSMAEINETKILKYLNEAIEIEKKGKKLDPEKFKKLDLPLLFSDLFREDKKLKKAFYQLTPGRQKEYILHINDAKQEVTQLKRLEKIKPMILEGKGLNDKYKK